MELTLKLIKEAVGYDQETGHFHWLIDRRGGGPKKGERAGFMSRDGLLIRLAGRPWPAARIAWAYVHGVIPEKQVCYLNGDNSDCRLANLRISGAVVDDLTQAQVRAIVDYDPIAGTMFWKQSLSKNVPVGAPVGRRENGIFATVGILGNDYTAQRLAWMHFYGVWPDRCLRFKNGDRRDIRIENLGYGEYDHTTPEGRRAYDKTARQMQKDRFRNHDLKKSFGITLDDYRAILEIQGGVCAICRQQETSARGGNVKWLAVDHCHSTGKVRGLLCEACNVSIGRMKEDTDRLRSAIAYLDRHKAVPADAPNVLPFVTKETA